MPSLTEFAAMHSGIISSTENVTLNKISPNILIISPDFAPYKAAIGFRTELELTANIHCLPQSKAVYRGVGQFGPGIWNIIKKQSCLYLLHL